MIEEIISHALDNSRGTIYVEFILNENDTLKTIDIEIDIDDLEEYCDLFEDIDWVADEDEEVQTMSLNQNIDTLELQEGLNLYLQDNKDLVEL
tara:strand:+ start:168 stop:446 length:279 start_codon:yes stop_codon:yes gene_type:complete